MGAPREEHPEIRIAKDDGKQPLDVGRLKTVIAEACDGLTDVDGETVLRETLKNLYDGVTQHDVNTALIMSAGLWSRKSQTILTSQRDCYSTISGQKR